MTNDIKVVIEELLFYAGKNLDMYEEDYILRRNNLLDLLKVDAPADAPVDNCRPLQEILDDVNEYAAENHLAEEWEKINFETRVMGLLMPMPFQVITTFEQLAASDPALATKYLYNLSVNSNYIRKVEVFSPAKYGKNSLYPIACAAVLLIFLPDRRISRASLSSPSSNIMSTRRFILS